MTKIPDIVGLMRLALERGAFEKAVFSKSADASRPRAVVTPRQLGGGIVFQAETSHADNKVTHENITPDRSDRLSELCASYRQVNLFTTVGSCEMRRASSGKVTVIGGEKLLRALESPAPPKISVGSNNREKAYLLSGNEPFLYALGISEKNGRVKDKKQAKFRQINRFLELIRDCLPALPAAGTLRVCDLCCGKSYLSFATYHYFANILGRKVEMTGVDLKPDVISYCSEVAKNLGFDGLKFQSGDVSRYDPGSHVHLVLSLHACDIATDLVLSNAVRWGADVILSTPCCHHELNHTLQCKELAFVAEYSMLRQKFCDAATDALRLKFLEASGYRVAALELIDPEETPKNILLRGIRRADFDPSSPAAMRARDAYLSAKRFLVGENDDVQKALFQALP